MSRAHNGRNPIERDGKVTTCHICSSTMHWSRSCPQRYKKDFHSDKEEECHVTLMASNEPSEGISSLMGEFIGSMVLDSGCSHIVCGIIWLNSFVEILNSGELASVSEGLSDALFRFGDGNRMKSLKYVEFPCILANKAIRIRTDVVDSDIPLLLSKSSMKRAGMIINMNDDTVHVFGQRLPLHTSSLGHYILPIYKTPTTALVNEVLVN